MPRLPCKVPRRHRRPSPPKRATRASPRLSRKTKVDVSKCHACHVKQRWMSPSATPAMQSAAASPATKPAQARHQSQPAPATQNQGRCVPVPRLPRKTQVDVSKCHACHVKRRWMSPSATPATQSAAASVCDKLVCQRWCVKVGVSQNVTKLC